MTNPTQPIANSLQPFLTLPNLASDTYTMTFILPQPDGTKWLVAIRLLEEEPANG